MRFDRDCFWSGMLGAVLVLAVLFLLAALIGAGIRHGRFLAAQDCIKASTSKEQLDDCRARYVASEIAR